jgi:hypothetical protein
MRNRRAGLRQLAGVMTVGLGMAAISLHAEPSFASTDAVDFDAVRQTPSVDAIVGFTRAHPDSPLVLELVQALSPELQPEACTSIMPFVSPDQFALCLASLAPAAGLSPPSGETNGGPQNATALNY